MLRRRTGKDKVRSNKVSGADSKADEERLRAEFGDAKVKQLVIKPRSKRRNGFIFLLGGIFGIFIALFFANQHEVISLESIMDLNLDSLMDAIPQGILRDVKEFSVCTRQGRSSLISTPGYFHLTDLWWGYSNTSAILSAMIHFLLDYTFNPRASAPNTPSS